MNSSPPAVSVYDSSPMVAVDWLVMGKKKKAKDALMTHTPLVTVWLTPHAPHLFGALPQRPPSVAHARAHTV